jgi:murein hydrolase activator
VLRVLFLIGLLVVIHPVHAQGAKSTAAQAAAEKKKLDAVKKEMQALSEEQKALQAKRDAASQALKKVDQQVASASRAARASQQQMLSQQARLEMLQTQKNALDEKLVQQKAELAKLIRSAYAQGDHAALELLLSQDKVNQSERALAYHRYLQQDQKAQILRLRSELADLAALTEQVKQQQLQVQQTKREQEKNLNSLSQQRSQRDEVLGQLDQQYKTKNERLSDLGRDEKNLTQVLNQLQALIAKREAEAAKAAKEKARLVAIAKAKANTKPGANGKTKANTATAAGSTKSRPANTLRMATVPVPGATNVPIGPLRLPVQGNVLAGFGGTMPDGHRSSGLLIAGSMGAEVRAASAGRVVYADWLKGYGLLTIIDHGNGWMSLYAYNDSLLKNVGDQVRVNEAIASLGRSGGQSIPALYFELRQNGQPKDPRSWLKP